MKILTRKEASKLDQKFVLCTSSSAKFFILNNGGWTVFSNKENALTFANYLRKNYEYIIANIDLFNEYNLEPNKE